MILGDGQAQGSGATFDELFRRAGVRDPQALALADPPNRAQFTDGAPRRLTFAEADRTISAFAARLRGLGLQTNTVVAIQLANTVESVIALLGVLRAGMIAAPLPLLWRRRDMVAALGRIGAKAIVTAGRIGTEAHAELAIEVAAELFPVRYVCAFGQNLPDGVVALDDCFVPDATDLNPHAARPGPAAAHIAVVTFETASDGLVALARSHAQLLAGGLVLADAASANILSTILPGSFAGIAVTLVPWLMAGSALHLHHAFDPETFAAQCGALPGATLVLPGPALVPLVEAKALGHARTIIALWRGPERFATAPAWCGEAAIVDVACFGEIGLLGARRPPNGHTAPWNANATGIETARTDAGTLALRGPMVPAHAFPPGAELDHMPHLAPDTAGFVDTGFACRRDGDAWAITAPPAGFASIGGYRLHEREVEALVAGIDAEATVLALPHAATGQRLAGSAADPIRLAAGLRTRGVNPLICGAFRPRRIGHAA